LFYVTTVVALPIARTRTSIAEKSDCHCEARSDESSLAKVLDKNNHMGYTLQPSELLA